ncbi:MAG: DHHA1 domain-containing protein [Haloarculaceae archaeon]
MTALAAAEPEVRTFTATVEAVDGRRVVLDQTYFYPEGGGQPADRGTVEGIDVTDVQHGEDGVVHELSAPPAFERGDTVEGVVDDDFRTYCMRAHTASHLLYGAGRRVLDDLGYGGFDISASVGDAESDAAVEGKVRVDFATSTEVDDATLVELERLTNRAVWEGYDVTWEELPREQALAREGVAFNTKTEEGLTGDTVRVVTVADWDVAACGGTHVRSTTEVGPVTVLERSNPGEGLTRVEFTVGVPAVDRRATDREGALAAAAALDTRVADLPEAVARLQAERDDLRAERDDLRADLVDARVAELRDEAVEHDGARWLVGTLPGLDANALADRAQSTVGDAIDVVAFVGADGQYLAVATSGGVDAGGVVDEVTDEFGGGGGGGPTVAQGGGLGADAAEVVAFLRD